jgi:hypothetical protein
MLSGLACPASKLPKRCRLTLGGFVGLNLLILTIGVAQTQVSIERLLPTQVSPEDFTAGSEEGVPESFDLILFRPFRVHRLRRQLNKPRVHKGLRKGDKKARDSSLYRKRRKDGRHEELTKSVKGGKGVG